eukprot:5374145-Prorocentrum_lima.AAC.1
MTSSLVGSEMCIRDSTNGSTTWESAPPGSPLDCPLPCTVYRLVTQGRVSVSYTHLTLPTICSV